ncbi:MAG: hypothetical protein MUE83_05270 [Tabrizicola sp.]|nr:hypothetical protein [Tabrizicola sp.]
MFIRMVGQFQVVGPGDQDLTPRGAKARALVALLCRTPDHFRPRRWLEGRLWSDRGQEQASGSLRQTLSELRKTLGPFAGLLHCDRDSVGLTGFSTDLDSDPEAARHAMIHGREFLEGIDIIDPAFCTWLGEERQRVSRALGLGVPATSGPSRNHAMSLRLGALPDGAGSAVARELAGAIARLTAEYLLRDRAAGDVKAIGMGLDGGGLPDGLDLHVEGAWSGDSAHLKLRLVAQADQKTVWSQRVIASRTSFGDDCPGAQPSLVFETTEAPLM